MSSTEEYGAGSEEYEEALYNLTIAQIQVRYLIISRSIPSTPQSRTKNSHFYMKCSSLHKKSTQNKPNKINKSEAKT